MAFQKAIHQKMLSMTAQTKYLIRRVHRYLGVLLGIQFFMWTMMHTMDYQSRNNLGNWLLRAFSVFGLVTILSGFTLFLISSKRFKN